MPIYPPHVATSNVIFDLYNENKCTVKASFVGSPRIFLTSDETLGYTEISCISGVNKYTTLPSAGSQWKWRALLGSGDAFDYINITFGSLQRLKEIKIHEDYNDNNIGTKFNGVWDYTSPVISTDLYLCNLNRGKINVVGSMLQNLQSFMTNDGSNWIPVAEGQTELNPEFPYSIETNDHYFTGSGRNIQFRLYDPTNTVTLNSVNVEWKGDDV